VPDWPGYQVSDKGRVRSVDRTLPDGRMAGGVILARSRHRYPQVTLSDGWRTRRVAVHKLVKLAFTGPSRGRQVRHLDDNPQNCHLSNLKYGTRKQNEQDKKRNQGKREREKERGRGRGKEEEKKRETDEIGRSFPGTLGCVTLSQRPEQP
jgi:NUMOD4 motif/HNH endonuclease